jgi:hypothetical protein
MEECVRSPTISLMEPYQSITCCWFTHFADSYLIYNIYYHSSCENCCASRVKFHDNNPWKSRHGVIHVSANRDSELPFGSGDYLYSYSIND